MDDHPSSSSGSPHAIAEDNWLDTLIPAEHRKHSRFSEFWRDTVALPRNWGRRLWRFARTTPGRMTAVVVFLSIAIAAAGISMSQTSADRRADLDTLMSQTEPVSYMAHNLYTSMSLADTTAAVGFVRSGAQFDTNRQQYFVAYQEAARAVALTATGLSGADPRTIQLITTINEQLPVYTGLIETAWANSRQGNPVGGAYMAEASSLMRTRILPAAEELNSITASVVAEDQRALAMPLWVPISGLFAALFFLALAQVWLAHTTHRRFNIGFVLATVFMVIATSWVTIANFMLWSAGSQAYEEASAPLEQISQARIAAQQARTNETLSLVRRQNQDSPNVTSFRSAELQVLEALDAYDRSTLADQDSDEDSLVARRAVSEWSQNHEDMVASLSAGDFEQALETALKESDLPGANGQTSYQVLDAQLAILVNDARETMRTYLGRGAGASDFVSAAVLTLSILSIISIWLGIRPRLQEFL